MRASHPFLQQMRTHGRDGVGRVGWRQFCHAFTPADGRQACSTDSRTLPAVPHCSTHVLPVHHLGGSLNRSRLFSQFTHAARGGRIGELCYAARLSAKFSRRLTESRAHQLRIGHEPGSNGTDPLHLERLSYGFVAMPNHRTSGVVNVGKEVVGERNAE